MVRKLLHQFPIKMWAIGSVLVHVDANWKDTNRKISQQETLITYMCKTTQLIFQVDAFIEYTCANYI